MNAMQIFAVLKSVKQDLTGFKFKICIPTVLFFLSLLLQGFKLCNIFFLPNRKLKFFFLSLLLLINLVNSLSNFSIFTSKLLLHLAI